MSEEEFFNSGILDEIKYIEDYNHIYIRVEKTYTGGKIIELRGIIYELEYDRLSRYQRYDERYLYKSDIKYGFEDDEYLILKNTLDYYKKELQ